MTSRGYEGFPVNNNCLSHNLSYGLEDLKLYGLSYMDHFYEKINVFSVILKTHLL